MAKEIPLPIRIIKAIVNYSTEEWGKVFEGNKWEDVLKDAGWDKGEWEDAGWNSDFWKKAGWGSLGKDNDTKKDS